jgi:hypothetical protein
MGAGAKRIASLEAALAEERKRREDAERLTRYRCERCAARVEVVEPPTLCGRCTASPDHSALVRELSESVLTLTKAVTSADMKLHEERKRREDAEQCLLLANRQMLAGDLENAPLRRRAKVLEEALRKAEDLIGSLMNHDDPMYDRKRTATYMERYDAARAALDALKDVPRD